jgi:serine/threonine-protein kinase
MNALLAEIGRAGEIALGPGHYALGRGFLTLGDESRARAHLESALQHGFQEPRAAYIMAILTGHLYQAALREAERLGSAELRAAKKRDIERRYRDPALAYLRQSEGADVPSPAYVAALIAFYEGRLDEALGHLDAMGDSLPYFYEAPALRGDILQARAFQRWYAGARAEARADFQAGERAFTTAISIGESVPALYEALGELEEAAMITEMYGEGDVDPSFARGMEAANRALAILPDHPAALLLRARLGRRMAEHLSLRGQDAEGLIVQALRDAERAEGAAPGEPKAQFELGRCYWQWGQVLQNRNQDPSAKLRKAAELFEGIRDEDRDYSFYTHLGLIHQVWADYEDQVGRDALPNRDRSIAAFRAAIALDASQPEALLNLGVTYYLRAQSPRAEDPEGDLAEALRVFAQVRARSPEHIVPYLRGGDAHERLATRKRARGEDARPDLGAALDLYREGQAKNPSLPHCYNGEGSVLLEQAREAWDRGGDPGPLLDAARAAYERAIAVAPEQGFGYHNVGEVLAQRALYLRARGQDPGPVVREAIPIMRKAIAQLAAYAPPWANLGMVHAIEASYELSRGRSPQASLAQATAALDEALGRNPRHAQSLLYLGETRGLWALWEARQGRASAQGFERAAGAYRQAIALAAERPEYRIAFGHFCVEWASVERAAGMPPGTALATGLDLARALLAVRPDHPDARVLQARLGLLQAEAAGTAQARALADRAQRDFEAAFAIQPGLEAAWSGEAARAQALAGGAR